MAVKNLKNRSNAKGQKRSTLSSMKNLKNNRWFKVSTNKFVVATMFFLVWMMFIDDNSWIMLHELNDEIEELETGIDYYSRELEINKKEINELESDPSLFEKFAREKYWMVRPGEEIYLIEVE